MLRAQVSIATRTADYPTVIATLVAEVRAGRVTGPDSALADAALAASRRDCACAARPTTAIGSAHSALTCRRAGRRVQGGGRRRTRTRHTANQRCGNSDAHDPSDGMTDPRSSTSNQALLFLDPCQHWIVANCAKFSTASAAPAPDTPPSQHRMPRHRAEVPSLAEVRSHEFVPKTFRHHLDSWRADRRRRRGG